MPRTTLTRMRNAPAGRLNGSGSRGAWTISRMQSSTPPSRNVSWCGGPKHSRKSYARLLGCLQRGPASVHLRGLPRGCTSERASRQSGWLRLSSSRHSDSHAAIEQQGRVPPVPRPGSIDRCSLIHAWDAILEINYRPVPSIARDLLSELRMKSVPRVMDLIAEAIPSLTMIGATTYHDLIGRMFQTLMTDREFLATLYTLA